jgi:hypothetical protein
LLTLSVSMSQAFLESAVSRVSAALLTAHGARAGARVVCYLEASFAYELLTKGA